jgi:hypothetical protein
MFSQPIRSLRAFLLVALFAGLAFSAAPAADPATRPPTITDIVLARSALAAIDADPKLGDANLLVSVVDRIAVVGGPVASNELVKRAETIVKGVPGIVEVKNRCFVQEGGDPLLRTMAAHLPPRRLLASELPGVVASPKTGLVEEYRPAPGNRRSAAVEPTEKSVVALRPMNPGASVLLPPVGASRPPHIAAVSPAPALLASRPADALAECEAIRKTDGRFAGLNLRLTNGAVEISGTAARAADAWDLAQKIRVVPGVPRVIMGQVAVR